MDTGIPTSHTTAASRRRQRPSLVWASRVAAMSLAVALVPLWLEILRPVTLGGPAGYTIVSGPSMRPSLESGDLVVTRQQGSYEIGDIIVYEVPPGEPGAGVHIIHRVVGGSAQTGYELKGDDRDGVDPWRPRPADIVGEVRVTVPQGGDVLLFLRTGLGLAILAGALALLAALAVIRSPGDEG